MSEDNSSNSSKKMWLLFVIIAIGGLAAMILFLPFQCAATPLLESARKNAEIQTELAPNTNLYGSVEFSPYGYARTGLIFNRQHFDLHLLTVKIGNNGPIPVPNIVAIIHLEESSKVWSISGIGSVQPRGGQDVVILGDDAYRFSDMPDRVTINIDKIPINLVYTYSILVATPRGYARGHSEILVYDEYRHQITLTTKTLAETFAEAFR